jgi:hypothetical protein
VPESDGDTGTDAAGTGAIDVTTSEADTSDNDNNNDDISQEVGYEDTKALGDADCNVHIFVIALIVANIY